MGLIDRIKGEFVGIVECTDDSKDTVVWRFPRHENEIKMGARLTVQEGQVAVLVDQGRLADVFGPGRYTLEAETLPVLSFLRGWRPGHRSPFRAEVYFVNTRVFADVKWDTQNPIMIRDAEFGMVRVRAFGHLALRVTDPAALLRELVGTDPRFRAAEVVDHLRRLIVGRLAEALAGAGIPVLDLAGDQDALGMRLAGILSEELAPAGVTVPQLIIEGISLPPEVERAVGAEARAGADGAALGRHLAPVTPPVPKAPAGPPPRPKGAPWYVAIGGVQQGPYDMAHLPGLLRDRSTLVWQEGMPEWLPAAQVPALNRLFAPAPLTQGRPVGDQAPLRP